MANNGIKTDIPNNQLSTCPVESLSLLPIPKRNRLVRLWEKPDRIGSTKHKFLAEMLISSLVLSEKDKLVTEIWNSLLFDSQRPICT